MTTEPQGHGEGAETINAGLLEVLEALRNECSGKPRPYMLIPLLERADRVIAAARAVRPKGPSHAE